LLSRLKDWNDRESWKDFFDTYWKLIYLAATKAGLTDPEAQDVVQETVISVCKSIRGFKYRTEASSFKSWLLQLTKWRIIDELRRRGREKEPLQMTRSNASSETATVERIPDPHGLALEAIWDREWDRNLMDAAIERVKRRVEAKQYQLFDLYVLKKWPVRKVATTLQVNAAQVYLAKHRVSALIRREIQYLEKRFV
jgi:RNA polymerase sigma-70 factor (ECF subfamily)